MEERGGRPVDSAVKLPPRAGGLLVIVALITTTFLLDLSTPLGVAIWMLYLLPLWLTMWTGQRKVPIVVGVICATLTIIGFFLSSPGPVETAIINRSVMLGTLGLVTLLVVKENRSREALAIEISERKRAEEDLKGMTATLERRVVERTRELSASRTAALDMMEKAEEARKKAEHAETALRESEKQLQAILDNATAIISMKDVHGRYLLINRRFESLFHLMKEQAIGKSDYDLFPKEMADKLWANDQQVMNTQTALEFDEAVPQDDGIRTYISVKCPLYDAAGALYAVCTISTDITERKQAEEQRDRFFSLSLDLFCFAGFDGYFKHLNPAWEKTLGYTTQELRAKPFINFVHPDDRASTLAESQKISAGHTTIAFENRYRCKDGSYRWLLWNASPAVDAQIIYATARDITERKETEAELKRHSAQLAAVNKELEAFSYSVSHDLRAPVRHIDGFADLLQKHAATRLDEKGLRYLKTISESAKQMGRLIDDLLVFARMGRADLRWTSVNLNEMVKEVCDELQPDFAGRQIAWTVNPLPEVCCDPVMIRQVLMNLIANAVKYTRTRPQATIEIGSQERRHEVVIFVRDNGVGFETQYTHKLFGVFQRLHKTNEFEGTGIGLANVRRIIQRHGGRTWADGSVGGGATFFFLLPRIEKP